MEEKLSSILAYIKAYRAKHKISHTRREIAAAFPAADGKPSSNAVVEYWIKKMVRLGMVRYSPFTSRSVIPEDEYRRKRKR